ncbi:MAG TPA: cysteine rich repeat-containing protein [Xanthomonadales bacterium]|nr:cysteine rich repeat-containing protein [Xanthomonadales bacterium]
MRLVRNCLLAVSLVFASASVSAQDLAANIQQGCGPEIKQYCSQVTLGEGRLLACFYAHEDKLSNQCIGVLYDTAEVLADAISTLEDIAEDCGADIQEFCGDVEMGDGRIAMCLQDHADELSEDCTEELAELAE